LWQIAGWLYKDPLVLGGFVFGFLPNAYLQLRSLGLRMFMPTFLAKREVFDWLLSGKKTIDVRRGRPIDADTVIFLSGPRRLTFRVVSRQAGLLGEVVHEKNFKQVIPTAGCVDEALAYFRGLYRDCEGVFTAYYVVP